MVAQVTLSLLLLIGAGLFLRSLKNLRKLGPGFSGGPVAGFDVDPSLNGYKSDRAKMFYQRLTESSARFPGVRQSVGLASMRILEDNEWDNWRDGGRLHAAARRAIIPSRIMNAISPDYFATLGVPIVEGRDFTDPGYARDSSQRAGQSEDAVPPW